MDNYSLSTTYSSGWAEVPPIRLFHFHSSNMNFEKVYSCKPIHTHICLELYVFIFPDVSGKQYRHHTLAFTAHVLLHTKAHITALSPHTITSH